MQKRPVLVGFRYTFFGQFRTPLHDEEAWRTEELKSIINLNFRYEFIGGSKAVEMMKKLLQSSWSIWPNKNRTIDDVQKQQ
jgi:hypothetical protein